MGSSPSSLSISNQVKHYSTANQQLNHQTVKNSSSTSSYFKKTVSLRDWWLIKSHLDDKLSVAGFTCAEQEQASRIFYSAPITKRFDVFTVQTSDGIVVIFKGFINKQKTTQNAFSSEIFDHFLFGFPPYWEQYAEKCFKKAGSIDYDNGNIANGAATNLQPTSSSPPNSVNLVDNDRVAEAETLSVHGVETLSNHAKEFSLRVDNDRVVDAEILSADWVETCSHHAKESSKRVDCSHGEINRKKEIQRSNDEQTNTDQSAGLGKIVSENGAPEECLIQKGARTGGPYAPVLNQMTRTEGDDMVMVASPLKAKKTKKKNGQTPREKDVLDSGITNSSTASLSQEAVLGCVEDVVCEENVLTSSGQNSSILEQRSNNFEDTTANATVQTVAEEADVTPSTVEIAASQSGYEKCRKQLSNLKDDKKRQPMSRFSMKERMKELTPEGVVEQEKRKLRSCLQSTSSKVDVRQGMVKTTRILRSLSQNLENKDKTEQSITKKGDSPIKKAQRKITFDAHVTPPEKSTTDKTHLLSPESMSLKRSRSGRLLLPTLDFWRNQIPVYDAGRNFTGIQEERRLLRGSKSEPQKKQNRRG